MLFLALLGQNDLFTGYSVSVSYTIQEEKIWVLNSEWKASIELCMKLRVFWIISHVDFKVVALLMIIVILRILFSQKVTVSNKNYTDTRVKRDVSCKAIAAVLNPSADESTSFPTNHIVFSVVLYSHHVAARLWERAYGRLPANSSCPLCPCH